MRLLPHPPNFAPVGATSLFAGARLPVWQAYLVPLALMAITDPILSAVVYHTPPFHKNQIFIYGSFLIAVWLGRRLRSTENIPRIAAFSVLNSIQFFALTNFGSWLWNESYARSLGGLASSYTAALPFFDRTLASELIYIAVLFRLYAWLRRTVALRDRISEAA